MKCPNCGAEYEDALLKCPYCKAENERAATLRYEQELSGLEKKEREIETQVPGRTKRKVRRRLALLFVTVLLLAGLYGITASLVKQDIKERDGEKSLEIEKKALAELEQLYKAEKYGMLWDCMKKYEGEDYYNSFQKYTQVYFVNESYQFVEDCGQRLDGEEPLYRGGLSLALESCGEVLRDVERYCSDGAVMGNEEVLADFGEKCQDFLKRLQMTEKEIKDLQIYVSEERGYERIKELAARLEERNQLSFLEDEI